MCSRARCWRLRARPVRRAACRFAPRSSGARGRARQPGRACPGGLHRWPLHRASPIRPPHASATTAPAALHARCPPRRHPRQHRREESRPECLPPALHTQCLPSAGSAPAAALLPSRAAPINPAHSAPVQSARPTPGALLPVDPRVPPCTCWAPLYFQPLRTPYERLHRLSSSPSMACTPPSLPRMPSRFPPVRLPRLINGCEGVVATLPATTHLAADFRTSTCGCR